jgi:Mg2+-importing ATPase
LDFSFKILSILCALPFLPLTATQILLNNFLSDLPALTLSGDRVDAHQLDRPQRWDTAAVRRFMLVFGLTSSVFDLLTFWLLLHVFQAPVAEFRSAWFVVSVLTELAVLLVLRTRRPAWRSRPSRLLWVTTAVVAAVATVLPFLPPVARVLGLVPLPGALLGAAIGVVLVYVAVTEGLKLALARRALKSRPSPI